MATQVIDLGKGNVGMKPAPANPLYPTIAKPPYIDAPDYAEPFDWNAAVIIPAIGSSRVIISFTVPKNRAGVIWTIGNGSGISGGIAAWQYGQGGLVWQVLRNGVPFKNFPNIVTIIGLVEFGGSRLSAPLRLQANDNIALIVNNVNVDPEGQFLPGFLGGYYYPSDMNPKTMR